MVKEVSITAFTHLKKEHCIISKRKLEKPLPTPFELPYNYPPIVMMDLAKKRLSGKARSKFIASVASAIFKCKNYPTAAEYSHVGSLIVKKYPFLRTSSGSGHVSTSQVHKS